MRTMVEILSEEAVKQIIRDLARIDPAIGTDFFDSFLHSRYGITLEQFDKVIKQAIPEHFI